METTPRIFRTTLRLSAAVAAPILSACTGIQLSSPAANAVVTLPSTTHVEITSARPISNVKVTVDGTDSSSKIAFNQTTYNYAGDLALTAGAHTIVASADAYCSYCTGQTYRASATSTMSVTCAGGGTNKTIFAQGDNLGWSSSSAPSVVIAADAGPETKWNLFPKSGGLVSVPGTIRSVGSPCLCLHSPSASNNVAVDLVACNSNDPFQIWDGTRDHQTAGVAFYQFRNEGVGAFNVGCLTEGTGAMAGKLIQSDCNATADRLWKVRNNTSNQFESDQTPWGQ